MSLPDGYSEVPPGKLAAVVTSLQMLRRPPYLKDPADSPWRLTPLDPDVESYRRLFRRVGSPWLWYSRLTMPRERLEKILRDPDNEVFALTLDEREEGLLELDFRQAGECELAFFGLTDVLQGRGAGRWLMNRAIERAWARDIRRLWVHTCTNDHPAALGFYLRSGFHAYARHVEVADDPRVTGICPPDSAPHVPIIRPA